MIEHTQKILIIDDDKAIRSMVRYQLQKANYDVIEAASGKQGLECVLSDRPSLILLDYLMPEMDGAQVFRELLYNPDYSDCKDIPVIILTAKESDQASKASFIEGGVSAYLQKPFGWQELVNVIDNVFILHRMKLKNRQLNDEIRRATNYLESVIDTTPVGIIAIDRAGLIQRVNSYIIALLNLKQESETQINIRDIPVFQQAELQQFLLDLFNNSIDDQAPRFVHIVINGKRISMNVNGVPVKISGEISGYIITIQDMTETERKQYELDMLSQISHFMHGTMQLEQLLHLTLTAITAGCALGFSRAMIFLINEKAGLLECRMGVGPANHQQALQIWGELSKERISLPAFLRKYGLNHQGPRDYFNEIVRQIKLPLNDLNPVFNRVINNRETLRMRCEHSEQQNCPRELEPLGIEDFVAVPLIARDRVIGLVVADNKFSNHDIEEAMVKLLQLFANQAGLAVERAGAYEELEVEKNKLEQAYRQLQQTQHQLIHAERLATVGKMAAQIAHEVRNPLVAVGGFARQIDKALENNTKTDHLQQYARIITDEVERLEHILRNVLDFSKLTKPMVTFENVNDLIEDICLFVSIRDEVTAKSILIQKHLDPSLPKTYLDPQQIKQVLFNVCQNAVHAMSEGGTLTIKTMRIADFLRVEISDTGTGIPQKVLDEIFGPFFTTKDDGTGLGLPISQQIIRNHGGRIEVDTHVGTGTTFSILLKLLNDKAEFDNMMPSFSTE
ncbi:response regulator [candidate division KSB1 bacterium]|nr:response regulator [candidate division KSB1 bacterium]